MRLATLLLFALLLPADALAGPLEDGKAAIIRGDWTAAMKLVQPLAEQGNAQAEADMGDIYMSPAFKKDAANAMKWYRKAADQGNPAGELGVGMEYGNGTGAPKDSAEALKWIRKAADQGYGPAELALAGIYKRGLGTKKDGQEAYFWFLLFRKSVPGGTASPGQISFIDGLYANGLTPEQIAAAKKRADEWKPTVSVPSPAPPLDLPAKAH